MFNRKMLSRNMLSSNFLNNKYVRLLVISLVIVVALSFVQDFADFLDDNSDKIIKLGVNKQCNPVTSICSASLINEGSFQRISFSIKGNVSTANDFPLKLTAIGFDLEGIESIAVSFEQVGGDLDENWILFSPDKSNNLVVPENWNASGKLPTVEDNRTDWLAVIRLKSSQKEYRAQFPFSQR